MSDDQQKSPQAMQQPQYQQPPQSQQPPQYLLQQQPQAVVVMQPMVSTTVVQQPALRDWSTGTCGCFEDISGCCYAMFCPSCFLCSLSTRMNENCCAMFVAPVAMRTKLRIENGIKGSVCNDYCTLGYCGQLVYCQMDRELKHMGR